MTLTTTLRTEAKLTLLADTASDLMVPNPISLRAAASAAEAMRLFTEKGITAAPVIDESGRPIGVISRSDLLIHKCVEENPGDGEYFRAASIEKVAGSPKPNTPMTVQDLMTPATTDSIQSDPLASSTTPKSTVPESPPIAIQGRIGMAMFLIVSLLLGIAILIDLVSAIFR